MSIKKKIERILSEDVDAKWTGGGVPLADHVWAEMQEAFPRFTSFHEIAPPTAEDIEKMKQIVYKTLVDRDTTGLKDLYHSMSDTGINCFYYSLQTMDTVASTDLLAAIRGRPLR